METIRIDRLFGLWTRRTGVQSAEVTSSKWRMDERAESARLPSPPPRHKRGFVIQLHNTRWLHVF